MIARQQGLNLLAIVLTIAAFVISVGLLAARTIAGDLLQALESLAGDLNATPAKPIPTSS